MWIRCTQPGHDEFFYNQASQRSSWTQGDKAIREALKGEEWVECASDDGRNYFVNLLDNRSSWTDHRSQAALAAALAEVHGGGGVCQDFFLAKAYAGARTLRLADGPDEVHQETIAKLELAKHALG